MTTHRFTLFILGAAALSITALLATSGAPERAASTACMRGDVNYDQAVNAVDAALILQLSVGLIDGVPCADAGNVDHNGSIDAVDSVFLLQRIAELIPALPALVRATVESPAHIKAGDEVVVNIQVEDAERLAGFDFDLSFSEDILTFDRVEDAGAFLRPRGELLCSHLDQTPVTCVTLGPPVCLGGVVGPSGTGILARAVFRAKAPGISSLLITDLHLVTDDISHCDADNIRVRTQPSQTAGTQIQVLPLPLDTPGAALVR